MTEWVCLLRGVNVGGITVRSADLRETLSALGLEGVRTVLASGNATFASEDAAPARSALKGRIEKALRDRFGYDAWVLLFSRQELADAADGFPFDAGDDSRQPWLLFCADAATRDELVAAAAPLDDAVDPVAPGPGVVYWNPPKGSSTDTPFAKIIARRAYRERTTNRNLRTVLKILS
ncbi:DUF1697 domain-containing protein [Microbacterium sp. RD1]|uniref:DUF1697 domain-containing protein n=1 Tax=Microbacterium sp. RD1 TaxID=3457313 RepID=UPI003FA53A9B